MSEDGGAINEEIPLSDDDSITASLSPRVSDDSGIEDWSDDMTIHTERDDGMIPNEILSEKCTSPELLHSLSPIKDENLTECIYPTLPEVYPINYDYSVTKRDILDDAGITGVCGLNNLGNTCFINAALQCILVTSALKNLVLEGDILHNGSDHMDEPANVLLFVERFQELFHKVLTGKYSVLHPNQFHMSVARLHPVLGDYKQHDSQEFLSFVLNALHDLLNRKSRRNKSHNGNADHISSMLNDTLPYGSDDDLSDNITGEVSKRLKMDNDVDTPMEPDAGVECEENLSKAECAWREYTAVNQSVIVDSFQGQFQSVIICEKCAFVSTTYEPFMFLSLPIPYAMEKQFVVMWVPSRNLCSLPGMVSVAKYCVTVHKNSCVSDIKTAFLLLVKKNDAHVNINDIILAEVDRSASVNILDDRTQISYISKTKSLYAIEVMRSYEANGYSLNNSDEQLYHNDLLNGTDNSFNKTNNSNVPTENIGAALDSGIDINSESDITMGTQKDSSDNDNDISGISDAAAWHSCGICLEEIFDEELKVHLVCGGVLCDTCLTNLMDMHKNQKCPCPICNRYISKEEYTPLVEPKENGEGKKTIRQILVPVMFRHESLNKGECSRKFNLFGHPVICSISSQVEPSSVLQLVNQILHNVSSIPLMFDVIITDGAGLSCGLCDLFSSCTGCHVKDQEILQLKPGSCLSVHFYDNVDAVVKAMNLFREDNSMKEFRDSDTVTLSECLSKFGDTELLTEDNPWHCTQCQRNQIAVKNMTVTRWPDTLIIHLKRFYYEGNQGCKLTCPVDFTLTDLNIDVLTCADSDSECSKVPILYDLYAFICHTGTLMGGHYTALSKEIGSSDWYYFNDESFEKMLPNDEHKEEGYVLFYQRKF